MTLQFEEAEDNVIKLYTFMHAKWTFFLQIITRYFRT